MLREHTADKYTLMNAWDKLSAKREGSNTHEHLLISRKEGAIAVKATILAAKIQYSDVEQRDKHAEWKA